MSADVFMSQEHREMLLQNIDVIAEKMTCLQTVLNTLVAKGIFHTSDAIEVEKSANTLEGQITTLVRYLVKKSDKGFNVFLEVLHKTKQTSLEMYLKGTQIHMPEDQQNNSFRHSQSELGIMGGHKWRAAIAVEGFTTYASKVIDCAEEGLLIPDQTDRVLRHGERVRASLHRSQSLGDVSQLGDLKRKRTDKYHPLSMNQHTARQQPFRGDAPPAAVLGEATPAIIEADPSGEYNTESSQAPGALPLDPSAQQESMEHNQQPEEDKLDVKFGLDAELLMEVLKLKDHM